MYVTKRFLAYLITVKINNIFLKNQPDCPLTSMCKNFQDDVCKILSVSSKFYNVRGGANKFCCYEYKDFNYWCKKRK